MVSSRSGAINLNNIVSLSGGKDSTAMLLMMVERGEDIKSVVFFDTGWEFPEMIEHVDKLEKYVGMEFVRLHPLQSFDYMLLRRPVKKSGRQKAHRIGYGWPSPLRRWCTGRKLDIIKKYYNYQSDFQSCIGFAADEAKRVPVVSKKKYPERYPLVEYDISEKEALEYCYDKGFDWDGLYEIFGRVSCFCCPLKRIEDYRKLRQHRPALWGQMLKMDNELGGNRGFRGYKTVHDLDRRFACEDRQLDLFETAK